MTPESGERTVLRDAEGSGRQRNAEQPDNGNGDRPARQRPATKTGIQHGGDSPFKR